MRDRFLPLNLASSGADYPSITSGRTTERAQLSTNRLDTITESTETTKSIEHTQYQFPIHPFPINPIHTLKPKAEQQIPMLTRSQRRIPISMPNVNDHVTMISIHRCHTTEDSYTQLVPAATPMLRYQFPFTRSYSHLENVAHPDPNFRSTHTLPSHTPYPNVDVDPTPVAYLLTPSKIPIADSPVLQVPKPMMPHCRCNQPPLSSRPLFGKKMPFLGSVSQSKTFHDAFGFMPAR